MLGWEGGCAGTRDGCDEGAARPWGGDSGEYALIPSLSFYVKELSVSSDGSLVAFGSGASNLGPTDSARPDNHDIYVAELVTPPA